MPKVRNEGRSSATSRQKRAAGLTCSNCRGRKIRCDGAQPTCGICVAYGETCQYDRPPPMTQIRAMADRIAQLEETVKLLRENQDAPSSSQGVIIQESSGDSTSTPTDSARSVTTLATALPPIEPVVASLEDTNAYYDTTSAVHRPGNTPSQQRRTGINPTRSDENCPVPHVDMLTLPDMQFWEEQAVESASAYLHLPQDVIRRLFATHWTWVHANFMFVPRAIFLRDLVVGGSYYSPFLLCVLCLHSTRFRERHLTEQLLAKAKVLFSHEIHNEGSIPLVQALLQFSAREIGRGSVSQAWLYGGMAFRVAIDMGLFSLNPSNHNSSEDIRRIQLGRHLAWSCFLWDKTLSLYLGRAPSLPEPPKWEPALPEAPELEMWPPYPFAEDEPFTYISRPAHLLLCFSSNCKIGVIINNILLKIYGSRRTQDVLSFIQATRIRLQAWRSTLPVALDVNLGGHECPPPHIVAQHMLYHTTVILLHRPFLGDSTCRIACQDAAESTELLLQLLQNSFGFLRFTYVMAYCTYTAATVVVQDLKDGRPGMLERFKMFIRALDSIRASCPGIQRSIDILTAGLDLDDTGMPNLPKPGDLAHVREHDLTLPPPQGLIAPMPAFPYHDIGHVSIDRNDGFNLSTVESSNPFFELDSFPQLWFDGFSEGVLNDFHI